MSDKTKVEDDDQQLAFDLSWRFIGRIIAPSDVRDAYLEGVSRGRATPNDKPKVVPLGRLDPARVTEAFIKIQEERDEARKRVAELEALRKMPDGNGN